MRIIYEMPLAQELLHFFSRQTLAGLDRRAARHRVEHVVQQIPASHLAVVLHKLFSEIFDDPGQIAPRNQRGMRHQQDRGSAEFLQFKTDLFQQVQ